MSTVAQDPKVQNGIYLNRFNRPANYSQPKGYDVYTRDWVCELIAISAGMLVYTRSRRSSIRGRVSGWEEICVSIHFVP